MKATFLVLALLTSTAPIFPGCALAGTNDLEDALIVFGQEDYAAARLKLEKCSITHPSEAPMLAYYIGECYRQTNDLKKARAYFERAFGSLFNRDEAAHALIQLCEADGQGEAARKYREYWDDRRENYESQFPNPKWSNAQPKGEKDADEFPFPVLARFPSGPGDEYMFAGTSLARGYPSKAVFHLERGMIVNLPLAQRFGSEHALLYYRKCAKAYRQKAALFKSKKIDFSFAGYDKSRIKEVKAAIEQYLAEHGDREAAEAEQLAEHYRLKAIVVEARLSAKKSKDAEPKSPTTGAAHHL